MNRHILKKAVVLLYWSEFPVDKLATERVAPWR